MKINYGKNDIAKELSKQTGYSFLYSKKLINILIKSITDNISISDVNLKNFGVFKVISKNERIGRNPKTREEFIISSRKSLKFIPSKNFLKYINKF